MTLQELMQKIHKAIDTVYTSVKSTAIVYGTVENVNPLVITIDDVGALCEEYFILGSSCKQYKVILPNGSKTTDDKWTDTEESYDTITATGLSNFGVANSQTGITVAVTVSSVPGVVTNNGTAGTDGHLHEIKAKEVILWNGLKVNDRVLCMRFNGGDRYFVCDVVSRTNLQLNVGEEVI
jgi:hypothetical protein